MPGWCSTPSRHRHRILSGYHRQRETMTASTHRTDRRMTRAAASRCSSWRPGPLAFYVFFVLLPLAQSMRISLRSWNGLSDPGSSSAWTTTRGRLRDPYSSAPSATPPSGSSWPSACRPSLGLLLAVLLDRPLRGSRFYKSAFYMPITLSLVVVGPGLDLDLPARLGTAQLGPRRRWAWSDLTRAWLGDPPPRWPRSSWPGAGSRPRSA